MAKRLSVSLGMVLHTDLTAAEAGLERGFARPWRGEICVEVRASDLFRFVVTLVQILVAVNLL